MDPQPWALGGLLETMIMQQSWIVVDDDAGHASSWAERHDDEVSVWPLLSMGAQCELHPGPWLRVGSCRSRSWWT